MEDQENTGVDQPTSNGANAAEAAAPNVGGAGAEAQDARREQLDELTQAYERARDELNDAVRTLRMEIAKIDLDQARTRARTWVDENPTLAVFLGIGAGIVTGRLLSGAFRSQPPPLSVRARHQADSWAHDAGGYANELSTAIAYHLGRAARAAGDAGDYVADHSVEIADRVGKAAREASKDASKKADRFGKDLSKQADRLGKDLSKHADRVGKDFSKRASHTGHDVSRRAEELADTIAASTSRSVHALEDAADDLSKTMKKRSKEARKKTKKGVDRGLEFSDTALNAARTAVAAVVVKKVSDWMKQVR